MKFKLISFGLFFCFGFCPVIEPQTGIAQTASNAVPSISNDFGLYKTSLQASIKSAWNPPNMQFGACGCGFTLEKNGSLAHLRLIDTSGVDVFDQAALAAIRNTAPIGQLPKGLDRAFVSATFDVSSGDSSVMLEAKVLPTVASVAPVPSSEFTGPGEPTNLESYLADLRQSLLRTWTPTANKDGAVSSTLKLGSLGEIQTLNIIQSSGIPGYDDTASSAIVRQDGNKPLPNRMESLKLKLDFKSSAGSKIVKISQEK